MEIRMCSSAQILYFVLHCYGHEESKTVNMSEINTTISLFLSFGSRFILPGKGKVCGGQCRRRSRPNSSYVIVML